MSRRRFTFAGASAPAFALSLALSFARAFTRALALAFALAVACLPWAAPPLARADTLTLEEAVGRALAQAPRLRAAETELAVARAGLLGAGLASQSNPELELSSGTRRADGQPVDLGLELWQEIEVGGRRRHRREAASALVASREARLAWLRAQAAADTRNAFAESLAARDRLALADEAVSLAARLDEAAARRFDAGAIPLLERNLARVRLGEARRERLAARRRETAALAALARLLSWPAGRELLVAGSLHDHAVGIPELAELGARAQRNRPDLLALRLAREASTAEARLARSAARPKLRVGLGWERDDGEEDLRVGLGLTLPVFQRNQAGRAASEARLQGADFDLASAELAVAQDVERAWRRLLIAEEDHEVFDEEVLAQIEENLELLQESFEAGKVSLLQVLPLQHELVEIREGHVDALAELANARNELALAAGLGPTEALQGGTRPAGDLP